MYPVRDVTSDALDADPPETDPWAAVCRAADPRALDVRVAAGFTAEAFDSVALEA